MNERHFLDPMRWMHRGLLRFMKWLYPCRYCKGTGMKCFTDHGHEIAIVCDMCVRSGINLYYR